MAKNYIDNLSEEVKRGSAYQSRPEVMAVVRPLGIPQHGRAERETDHRSRPRPWSSDHEAVRMVRQRRVFALNLGDEGLWVSQESGAGPPHEFESDSAESDLYGRFRLQRGHLYGEP